MNTPDTTSKKDFLKQGVYVIASGHHGQVEIVDAKFCAGVNPRLNLHAFYERGVFGNGMRRYYVASDMIEHFPSVSMAEAVAVFDEPHPSLASSLWGASFGIPYKDGVRVEGSPEGYDGSDSSGCPGADGTVGVAGHPVGATGVNGPDSAKSEGWDGPVGINGRDDVEGLGAPANINGHEGTSAIHLNAGHPTVRITDPRKTAVFSFEAPKSQ